MVGLLAARPVVALVGIERWRGHLGLAGSACQADLAESRRLARHVGRGAGRLPFASKCLPRAMVLSRMLRQRGIANRLVIAARPAEARDGTDDLHAWVEVAGQIVLGDLPGPWLPLYSLPQN